MTIQSLLFISFFILIFRNGYAQYSHPQSEINITANSVSAFENFIIARGLFEKFEMDSAKIFLEKALLDDPDFIHAKIYRSLYLNDQTINLDIREIDQSDISQDEKSFFIFLLSLNNDDKNYSDILLNELINIFPVDKRIHNVAGIYCTMNQLYDKAKFHFNTSIFLDSTFIVPYYNLAVIHSMNAEYETAEKIFNKILNLTRNNSILHFEKGKNQFLAGNLYISTDELNKANSIEFSLDAALLLSAIYIFEGYYNLARETLNQIEENINTLEAKESAVYFTTLSYLYENNLEAAKNIYINKNTVHSEKWEIINTSLHIYEYPSEMFLGNHNPFDKNVLNTLIKKYLKNKFDLNSFKMILKKFPIDI